MDSATGMETALARAQKSPPGQAMILVSRPILGVARLSCCSSCQRSCSRARRTSARTRFCSCETRSSPKP
ncbi:Uncharacterised protein [Bordetella pertussis]|nr:Uncharacterised protein [Bordetella pertussis]